MSTDETFLVLGGGGMIGAQVVHEIAGELKPRWIIIHSKNQKEVRELVQSVKREFPYVQFISSWGDIFLRSEWNTQDRQRQMSRAQLLESAGRRREMYDDVFHDFDEAYERSELARLIRKHKPAVVVDCINTATGISYQDIYTSSEVVTRRFDGLNARLQSEEITDSTRLLEALRPLGVAVESLLISQSIPQLIRHVLFLHRAMSEAETRLYLKIGTTGTGGMGLNIPYTHSEDKPSPTLMTKTAIAFAQTGLMFLMARTPGGPVVKEIKPGAMVGYANVTRRSICERGKQGKPIYLFDGRAEPLGATLTLRQPEGDYERFDKLRMAVIDTGENGLFTKGEFEAITHLWQMEYITPEEIAKQVVLEVRGSNTGYDVIAAIDSSVMNPTYRAGYLRQFALEEITRLEALQPPGDAAPPSVALGQLGPPELGKLLWEAYLLKRGYETLSGVVEVPAEALASEVYARLKDEAEVRQTIVSVGIPILTPDGRELIRGPYIRIPEALGAGSVEIRPDDIDTWASKGWVDLRPSNFERWRQRFIRIERTRQRLKGRGSAAISREAYLPQGIEVGALVAWIFNNEELGYRIK